MRWLLVWLVLGVMWAVVSAARLPPLLGSASDAAQQRRGQAVGASQAAAESHSSGPHRQWRGRGGRRSRAKRRQQRDQYLLWLRTGECAPSETGEEQFFCPTPATDGSWSCVGMTGVCDGVVDCPGGEDELATGCFFYKVVTRNVELVAQSLLHVSTLGDARSLP